MSTIVICGGGGGIPVARNPVTHEWEGKAAVIDKDRTAALLAKQLGADILCILTDIDGVYRDFKKPTQHMLATIDAKSISATEEKALLSELPAGSMRPKVEAGLAFVRGSSASAYRFGLVVLCPRLLFIECIFTVALLAPWRIS